MNTNNRNWTIPIAVLIIAAALFALYMFLYRRQLNAALNSDSKVKVSKVRMASPAVMLAALAIVGGSVIGIHGALGNKSIQQAPLTEGDGGMTAGAETGYGGGSDGKTGGIDIGKPKFWNFTRERVQSTLLGDYTPGDEIKGYLKYEYTDGDIRFVYYANNSCGIMPALLIYAEYTGSEKVTLSVGDLHIDNTDWDGKEYDMEGWITEDSGVWYSVENFFTTGSMTLTHTAETESDEEVTGKLTIDIRKAFNAQDSVSETADSTAE